MNNRQRHNTGTNYRRTAKDMDSVCLPTLFLPYPTHGKTPHTLGISTQPTSHHSLFYLNPPLTLSHTHTALPNHIGRG